MRVLVCGGREYNDFKTLWTTLDEIQDRRGIDHLITGCAQGADWMAWEYAASRDISSTRFHADWNKHGKAAGPLRNQRMIDEGRPALVIAFPGGRGTADMVRRARVANLEVLEIAPTRSEP